MRYVVAAVIAAALGVATVGAGSAIDDSAGADARAPLGPGLVTVPIGVEYSKFSPSQIHVRAGTTVRFLIRNDDPINHEFVVGDRSVHRRHEQGTERAHPPVPGEVSVGPNDVGVTIYRFDRPGRYLFACHLPRHFEFGMRGDVVVEPRDA